MIHVYIYIYIQKCICMDVHTLSFDARIKTDAIANIRIKVDINTYCCWYVRTMVVILTGMLNIMILTLNSHFRSF